MRRAPRKSVKTVIEKIKVVLSDDKKRGDDEIVVAAIHRLAWVVSIPPDSVKLKVENGWVTLSRRLDWQFQRTSIEHDISRLIGVTGVTNDTVLTDRVDADNFTGGIMSALQLTCDTTQCAVSVDAHEGKIPLRGSVYSQHDRYVAAATAWTSP